MGNSPAGGTARLIHALRTGTTGASIISITEGAAPAASLSGEVRHAR
jgi:hypothetical protein